MSLLFPDVTSDPLGSLGTLGTRLTGSLGLLRLPDLLFGDPRQAATEHLRARFEEVEPLHPSPPQFSSVVLLCCPVLTSLGLSFSICKMGLYL